MQEKLERNRAFWLSWKRDDLTNEQLSKKYDLKICSIKQLKRVLRLRGYNENGEPMKNRPRFYD